MATELEVKSFKGAATIAVVGLVAVLVLVVVTQWAYPAVKTKLLKA